MKRRSMVQRKADLFVYEYMEWAPTWRVRVNVVQKQFNEWRFGKGRYRYGQPEREIRQEKIALTKAIKKEFPQARKGTAKTEDGKGLESAYINVVLAGTPGI